MPSFDIVSKIDLHELTNAVDQANRELGNRFDFKGTDAVYEREGESVVVLKAQADFQLKQMLDILKQRLAARHIDIGCAEIADAEINLATAKQKVTLKQGIEQPLAKDIIKRIKECQAQGRDADPGRQAAHNRQEARRPADRDGVAARGGGGDQDAAAIRKLPRLKKGFGTRTHAD